METKNKISRFEAREQCFLLIFEKMFNPDSVEDILTSAVDCRDLQFCDYAIKVVNSIDENIDKIDSVISGKLKAGWSLKRISKTSLAILRLAVYEMLFEEKVPNPVAINEAVELAKKYTVDESKFVNGVLGAISKEI